MEFSAQFNHNVPLKKWLFSSKADISELLFGEHAWKLELGKYCFLPC